MIVFGLAFYLWSVNRHSGPPADEGPAEAASEIALDPPVDHDFALIKQRGTLIVLAPYNSTTYFLYRGEPMGYEYELLRAFAKEKGLTLQIEAVRNQKLLFQKLNRGEGDIAAARLIPKEEDKEKFRLPILFTGPSLLLCNRRPRPIKPTSLSL